MRLMIANIITQHFMPPVIRGDFAQDRKTIGNETFYIVIDKFPINAYAPIFNTFRGRVIFRIAHMLSEHSLNFSETFRIAAV